MVIVVFYNKIYVKTDEVKDFNFKIWKILNKMSKRFNKYPDAYSIPVLLAYSNKKYVLDFSFNLFWINLNLLTVSHIVVYY